MYNFLKKIIFIILITFVGFVNSADNKEKLIMGTSPDYPIFEFIKNGEIVGLDLDLARLICERLNKELIIKTMDFSSLIPAIQSGKIDFAMAGFSKEETRLKFVDFSDIYFKEDFALVSTNNKKLDNLEALANKKIIAQTGSTSFKYANELQKKVPSLQIKTIENNFTALEELKSGRVDILIIGSIQAKIFANNNPNLFYTVVPNDIDNGTAIIFKKNSDLTEKFNVVLKGIKEEGKIEELKQKWLSDN